MDHLDDMKRCNKNNVTVIPYLISYGSGSIKPYE